MQIQTESFDALKTEGIREVLDEINPIQDVSGTRFELRFGAHAFRAPKYTEEQCREKEATYEAPLYVTVELEVKETGEIKEQTLFFGDIPMMTPTGTFVINGAERVVVSQLVRSRARTSPRCWTPARGATFRSPSSYPIVAHGSSSKPARGTSCRSRSTASASCP